jgi:hypothetical protein
MLSVRVSAKWFSLIAFLLIPLTALWAANISPEIEYKTYAVTASSATSEEIKFQARGGQVHIPAASSITSLTWYTAEKSGGTYMPAYTEDGTTAVTQTSLQASRSYPIPSSLFGASWIKAVGNAAGSVHIAQKG